MRLDTQCIVILALAVREQDYIHHKISDAHWPSQNECRVCKHVQTIKAMSCYTKRAALRSERAP